MSFVDTAISDVAGALSSLDAAANLLGGVLMLPRTIGGFLFADCTVEEEHEDRLRITEHPVEQGAAITDHAFKEPARCTVTVGWSNSSSSAGGDSGYIQQIYATVLDLQASRVPFILSTGKRGYVNMLAESVVERTTVDYENAMILVIRCREVILVSTQTVTVPSSANMKAPQLNAPPQDRGTVSAAPGISFNQSAVPGT